MNFLGNPKRCLANWNTHTRQILLVSDRLPVLAFVVAVLMIVVLSFVVDVLRNALLAFVVAVLMIAVLAFVVAVLMIVTKHINTLQVPASSQNSNGL